jgi:L-arabinokinase
VGAAATFLPAPVAELLKRMKDDTATILSQGHKEVFVGRAPGRLDVMGGIADYTGSLACEMPLDAAAAVAVQRRDDRRLVLKNYGDGSGGAAATQDLVEMSLDDFYGTASLLPDATLQGLFAGPRQWAAGAAGTYPALARHKNMTRRTAGANVGYYSNVPTGGGAASTLATACATLAALMAAYHFVLEPLEAAMLANSVQYHVAGVPGGVADAATAMLGRKDQLLLFSGTTHSVKGYLPIPPGFTFAGIHTALAGTGWMDAVRKLRMSAIMAHAIIARMYKDLGMKKDPTGGYLAKVSPMLLEKYFLGVLPESVVGRDFVNEWGPVVDRAAAFDAAERYSPRSAALYHVMENARTQRFVEHLQAMAQGPQEAAVKAATEAGQLMVESHRSAAEHAGLRWANTDQLVELVMQRGAARGFYGARANGGTVAVLAADTAEVRDGLAAICAAFEKKTGTTARLLTASSAGSAEAGPIKMMVSEL